MLGELSLHHDRHHMNTHTHKSLDIPPRGEARRQALRQLHQKNFPDKLALGERLRFHLDSIQSNAVMMLGLYGSSLSGKPILLASLVESDLFTLVELHAEVVNSLALDAPDYLSQHGIDNLWGRLWSLIKLLRRTEGASLPPLQTLDVLYLASLGARNLASGMSLWDGLDPSFRDHELHRDLDRRLNCSMFDEKTLAATRITCLERAISTLTDSILE